MGLRPVGGLSAGPAKVSSFSRCLVTPPAFADPRLTCAVTRSPHSDALCEGSPVPREPVLPASAARRARAQAARRERSPWMDSANARRRGTGDPEATLEPVLLSSLLMVRPAKVAIVSSPRVA